MPSLQPPGPKVEFLTCTPLPDRAAAAHDRQPALMGGMTDVAPRVAVKDEVQRGGAGRDLHRAGERHPPDRDVAHARSEVAARHRRRRPASAATVTIDPTSRPRSTTRSDPTPGTRCRRPAPARTSTRTSTAWHESPRRRHTPGKERCQSGHDERTEKPACHSIAPLVGSVAGMPKRMPREEPCGWTARNRDTAQTLAAPEGTPAPDRWFPCLGRVFARSSAVLLEGRTVGVMPCAAAVKRGRSTHRSTAARRRRDR